jgi:uncharacterized membrane protein
MALLVPDVGEVVLLASILYPASGENWTLKLYSGNVTPAETDTAASYTEATFTGYTAKTLTRTQSGATWAVPTTSTGTTSSIYGYYVVGATSTTLLFAELFSSVKNLANNDTLTVTPRFQLD